MKNVRTRFVVIGIISVILGIVRIIWGHEIGSYESMKEYGGDAYTGIQHAAAQSANNIKDLSFLVGYGFGAILFVAGLCFVAYGFDESDVDKMTEQYSELPVEESYEERLNSKPLETGRVSNQKIVNSNNKEKKGDTSEESLIKDFYNELNK